MKGRLLWTALLAVLVGCSDGYSEEEESLNLHMQMSQAEALAALNAIAERPHLQPQRQYRLHQDCELEVTTRDAVLRPSRQVAHLARTETALIKEDGGDVFTLLLRPRDSAEPASTSLTAVLTEGTWGDAAQAKWILNYLLKFCLARPGSGVAPTQPLAGGGYFKLQPPLD
ncbi:MAG: hypothetical protein U5L74_07350 [Ideonella sp.]|nr:hypothetical protein [Ideonella sp.]